MTAIFSYFYFQLGGISNIEKNTVDVDNYLLIAMPFKGRYNSSELEEIFYSARAIGDQIVIINYPLPGDSTRDGFISQLIGTRVSEVPTNIPIGFQPKTIEIAKVVQAKIDAHNLVMPKPNEIEEALRTYAEEQKLSLESYTIERYISNRELIIEIPIIQ